MAQIVRRGSKSLSEQQGSKCTNQSCWKTTNHSRASCFIRSRMTSWPHRLKKTSSMQSKRRDLHHTWLHRETNEKRTFLLLFTTMNNHSIFHEINVIYGRTVLRLIRQHERCSSKLARYTNHLTFLTRCIKNRVVPKDLRVRPPVPTKGARRVAELASMRFLRERIRLTQ